MILAHGTCHRCLWLFSPSLVVERDKAMMADVEVKKKKKGTSKKTTLVLSLILLPSGPA